MQPFLGRDRQPPCQLHDAKAGEQGNRRGEDLGRNPVGAKTSARSPAEWHCVRRHGRDGAQGTDKDMVAVNYLTIVTIARGAGKVVGWERLFNGSKWKGHSC